MGEDDAGAVVWQRRVVEGLANPGRGVARLMTAEQGGREEDGRVQNDRLRGQQDVQVGGEFLFFPLEKLLFPQAVRAAVIVVPRNDKNRDSQRANGGTRR